MVVTDWRWVGGLDDTLWYPTMRLFRQGRLGEWRPGLHRVADDLARLAARRMAA